jgi:4,5-DOPA dioxygenase extradiol
VNHGGGPTPLLNPKPYQGMYDHLRSISQAYPNPKAIIIISAHW